MARWLLDIFAEGWEAATNLCCSPSKNPLSTTTFSTATRQYHIQRTLGEGGFSHVFLVKDQVSGEELAAKRILCQHGMDTFARAQNEMDMYRRFQQHRNIVSLLDSVVFDDDVVGRSHSKAVYMVFPVYRRGSLLDLVTHNQETGTSPLDELFVVDVFRALCDAVSHIHNNREEEEVSGYVPLQTSADRVVPYVHGDIKLANVMVADDGHTPVLMDLGSCREARFVAHSRLDALRIQDDAAEHCSLAYRAPELFDVQPGACFDERTDVWALGCLLFALAYARTPFDDAGSSVLLAALNRGYKYPDPDPYSPRIRQIIDFMLDPDPAHRPFIDQVIALTSTLYP
ncbi:Serine/threonine-protein kinase env7 [Coemansia sp. BCRC 34301]|nr:Serine/threonine-protein kinase env7 [Coemansia sp. BCRC 34301]